MIDITIDMEQYDCPYIDISDGCDVSFSAAQWEFDRRTDTLETRMITEGADRDALDNGLGALREHPNLTDYDLLSRQDRVAHVRTTIEETAAMHTIRESGGYITGPFHIEEGSELWHVGFDREDGANGTLAELERQNEFDVVARRSVELADLQGFVQNVSAAMTLIEACRDLSETERRTLEAAVDEGYFECPRGATLGTLAERFDVSKSAVSKTLRRGQSKTISRVAEALRALD
ncbi:helix-turn-helix domain-containing protein [Halomarina ordinaria]|uniref:Helix-turn-helix domain-containing protein n=1 Tax=Halomarina ordinaria TaxID=3033939 RepID=A0ABD5U8V4_9EURY|nr:helix-turn-helix domain-containing protein [Halomarina sp. PSRA2]